MRRSANSCTHRRKCRTASLKQWVGPITLFLLASSTGGVRAQVSTGGNTNHLLLALHAEGAQVYECRADRAGVLSWRFREPRATLTLNNKVVGRHYAGPTWELADGSAVVGKVVSQSPGPTAKDIAMLKLEVIGRRGRGRLTTATSVRRLNTRGGVFAGPCTKQGAIHDEPYIANYVFSDAADAPRTLQIDK